MFDQVVEVGQTGGHGDGAAAEGGDRVGAQAVHDVGAGDDTADRHAVADALGEGEDVGRPGAVVRLPAPEVVAGAAPAGLHLIGDPQDAVPIQHLAEGGEQPVGRGGEAADALDRLGDQRGDIAVRLTEDVLEVGHARLDELAVGQPGERATGAHRAVHVQRLERGQAGRRPAAVAGDADGREGAAVVAVAHRQDLVGAAVGGGEQQGRVIGLGAGGGEEDPRVRDAGQRGHPLGQVDHGPVEVERGGVQDPAGLLADRLGDLGEGVGGHRGEDTAEEVEVAVALGVPDVASLAVGDLDGALVVDGEPVGEYGLVAGVEGGVGAVFDAAFDVAVGAAFEVALDLVAAHGRTSPS
ncbi:hypothetical protein SVIO_081360 [Streptomyces violaceusniger]|uniref:Uncharacterized protein n=1 Tax=Streptomyces violaceusniger TaxID=68280 RepID=A0A4D4LHC6_STRVO|nr:hypothetical protein SVIO_081360 [Streptomyces violaceusniger]